MLKPRARQWRRAAIGTTLTALILLAALAACSPLAALTALAPTERYAREQDVAYGGAPRQRLDVYAPADAEDAPIVVFFYGGRWSEGERGEYAWVGANLAAHGIVTVIPDYRLYPQVRFPTFVEDGAAAVRWVQDHVERLHGDPDRVFVMGHSAGGHIAALLALDRRYLGARADQLAGMIGLAGPYDFLPLEAADLKDMFGPPSMYPRSQPIHFARGDAPPMLLLHGLADTTVSPDNTRSLARRIRSLGGSVTTDFYEDVDHTDLVAALSNVLESIAPVRRTVVDFVRRHRD